MTQYASIVPHNYTVVKNVHSSVLYPLKNQILIKTTISLFENIQFKVELDHFNIFMINIIKMDCFEAHELLQLL